MDKTLQRFMALWAGQLSKNDRDDRPSGELENFLERFKQKLKVELLRDLLVAADPNIRVGFEIGCVIPDQSAKGRARGSQTYRGVVVTPATFRIEYNSVVVDRYDVETLGDEKNPPVRFATVERVQGKNYGEVTYRVTGPFLEGEVSKKALEDAFLRHFSHYL